MYTATRSAVPVAGVPCAVYWLWRAVADQDVPDVFTGALGTSQRRLLACRAMAGPVGLCRPRIPPPVACGLGADLRSCRVKLPDVASFPAPFMRSSTLSTELPMRCRSFSTNQASRPESAKFFKVRRFGIEFLPIARTG